VRIGKFTHPSSATNNDLFVVWTSDPANDLNRPASLPYYDAGLYLTPNGIAVTMPSQLVLIKNHTNYNEALARAVVLGRWFTAQTNRRKLPWLPNDDTAHSDLPPGMLHGIVSTFSFYKREGLPGYVPPWPDTFDGLNAFNTSENGQICNWEYQGSGTRRFWNNDIHGGAQRCNGAEFVSQGRPRLRRSARRWQSFVSHANERLRILGEIRSR